MKGIKRECPEGESNRPSFEFGDALPHPNILIINIPDNIKKSIGRHKITLDNRKVFLLYFF